MHAKRELFALFNSALRNKAATRDGSNGMSKLLTELAQKNFAGKTNSSDALLQSSEKALSQRMLRKEYTQDKTFNQNSKSVNYLDFLFLQSIYQWIVYWVQYLFPNNASLLFPGL